KPIVQQKKENVTRHVAHPTSSNGSRHVSSQPAHTHKASPPVARPRERVQSRPVQSKPKEEHRIAMSSSGRGREQGQPPSHQPAIQNHAAQPPAAHPPSATAARRGPQEPHPKAAPKGNGKNKEQEKERG